MTFEIFPYTWGLFKDFTLHYSSGPITIIRTLWYWGEDASLLTFTAPINTRLKNQPRSQAWAILSCLISDLWHPRRLQATPLQRTPTSFPAPHIHRLWLNGTHGRCSFSTQIFMELNPGSKRGIHTVPLCIMNTTPRAQRPPEYWWTQRTENLLSLHVMVAS